MTMQRRRTLTMLLAVVLGSGGGIVVGALPGSAQVEPEHKGHLHSEPDGYVFCHCPGGEYCWPCDG